jgi:hypothetical protein
LPEPASDLDPLTYVSYIVGIRDMHHHTHLVCWGGGLTNNPHTHWHQTSILPSQPPKYLGLQEWASMPSQLLTSLKSLSYP